MKHPAFTRFRRTIAAMLLAGALLLPLEARVTQDGKGEADEALVTRAIAIFGNRTVDEVFDYLDSLRPAAVSAKDKKELLKDIALITPQTRLTDTERLKKLKAHIQPVLALHRRILVPEFIIFQHHEPIVLTKPGTLLAFSTTFLKLAEKDTAGLMGSVAHEVAHEYVALQMLDAMKNGDVVRIRELELFCDAVAVASLIALGIETSGYKELLIKVITFSPEAARLNDGHNGMPNLQTRLRLIDEFGARLDLNAKSRNAWETQSKRARHIQPAAHLSFTAAG